MLPGVASIPYLWTLLVFLLTIFPRPTNSSGRLNYFNEPFDFRVPRSHDPGGKGKVPLRDECKAGRLCAGPGAVYPIGHRVGVVVEGEFVVPPLPKSFNKVETTYYDYLNIFWPTNPSIGHFNQFVPQLMLGNSLANSSNSPDYEPQWLQLDTWHIGSQYFMALCRSKFNATTTKMTTDPSSISTSDNRLTNIRRHRSIRGRNDCTEDWIAKAYTGQLIPVEPGEGVYTRFELVQKSSSSQSQPSSERDDTDEADTRHGDDVDVEWHLSMGVIGDKTRVSSLVVGQPFMGLLEPYNSTSWMEDIYRDVYVGSCLENYGMVSGDNYPSFWRIDVEISLPLEPSAGTDSTTTTTTTTATTSSNRNDINVNRILPVEHNLLPIIEDRHDGNEQHGDHQRPTIEFWKDWRMDHDYDCDWQPRSLVKSFTGVSQDKHYQIASWEAWLPLEQRRGERDALGHTLVPQGVTVNTNLVEE